MTTYLKHDFRALRFKGLRLIVDVLPLILTLSLNGCSTYGDRVAPVPLPAYQADHIDVQGAILTANPYVDPKAAKAAFGFNVRGAGLLPVRFVIDNQSGGTVKINPGQTFLIDEEGQAWPLLTSEQAYQRVSSFVELGETAKGAGKPALLLGTAGAIAGFAIGVLVGEDLGEAVAKGAAVGAGAGAIYGGAREYEALNQRIWQDLEQKSLRNQRIRANELAYGYLFFPGKDEARSAKELRLGLEVNDQPYVVNVPLHPQPAR